MLTNERNERIGAEPKSNICFGVQGRTHLLAFIIGDYLKIYIRETRCLDNSTSCAKELTLDAGSLVVLLGTPDRGCIAFGYRQRL